MLSNLERSSLVIILSREVGQSVVIGNLVRMTVVGIRPNSVRLGIEAPRPLEAVHIEPSPQVNDSQPIEKSFDASSPMKANIVEPSN